MGRAGSQTEDLQVEFLVELGPFTLRAGCKELRSRVHEGAEVPSGVLPWSLANDLPWLEASPPSGPTPAEVTLAAVLAGLAPGVYTGQIAFTAQGAQGSPDLLTVNLTVLPRVEGQGPRFIRGDSNADGRMNISDASFTLTYLFLDATKAPPCLDAADSNDDAKVSITDAIYSLGSLFLGGPAPPEPFPGCGEDPTADALECGGAPGCR
ncbi:MAG: hypothetical protein HY721_21370 [Planctomycetes bacterium]|nr:hypothetical protein [Planctomycetota bacterium]